MNGMLRPGIEILTSRSPERTLYQLSYQGQFDKYSMLISTNIIIGSSNL